MSVQKQLKYKKKLPSGDRFMPNMTKETISEKIKEISCGKPRDILMACLHRKTCLCLREIARQLMRPWSTVRGWLVRITKRGIAGIWDKKSTGRKRILNPSDVKKMEKWMYENPAEYGFQPASWNMDMVVDMFKRMIGKCRCTQRTLRRALQLSGFSYSKPRPILCLSASPEAQEKFKVEVKKEITRLYKLGYAVFAGDETRNVEGIRCRIRMAPKKRLQYNQCRV